MRWTLKLISFPLRWLWDQCLASSIAQVFIASIIQVIHYSQTRYISSQLKSCGLNLRLQFPIHLLQPNLIEIGDNVSIAAYVHVWGGGGVKIGNRVMIGSHTAITSITHDYSVGNMYQTIVTHPIVIEDDVWIGTHAVILPGVTIGKGAVIGAGCIVTKNVLPQAVMTGVPGRVLKFRCDCYESMNSSHLIGAE